MKPEKIDMTLDARNLSCPLPVVKATKASQSMSDGQVLEILATDKGAQKDIPAWCQARKNTLLHQEIDGNVYKFYVRKGN